MQQNTNIQERLRELRKKLGLSQTDFGKKIGKNYHSVMRWEIGRVLPPANVLKHIADLYNVSFEWLTEGEGEMFTDGSVLSEKQHRPYSAEKSAQLKIPFLESYNSGFLSLCRDRYISIPDITEGSFAAEAPFSSSPPLAAGDIVIFEECVSPSSDDLYIITDKYGDILIRWYCAKQDIWCSKRPDYPDIPIRDTAVFGKMLKIIREITL